ncbi:MAG: domain containing protein [Segetibacter sp.]|nr:domain containing protein [Segetibacter sp.]
MIFKSFLKTIFYLFIFPSVGAQDLSNKGTEFWVGYGYHHAMTHVTNQQENEQDMVLYFTADENATVKVEIPALGWTKTYAVSANNVTESDAIPKIGSQDARLLLEQVYKSGIHITSDKPIVAYAHIYNASVSGATLLFPVATLGQDYYSINFTQRSNTQDANSWVYVIATEDKTTVEITPSANTLTHVAGQPFTVSLNKGEIYNLMGTTSGNVGVDLTGTRIRSISTGTSGCKKIAVFSGSGRLSIYCGNTVTTSDNVIQQAFPRSAWGKKFLTVPTAKLPNNYFRIVVSDPSTVVTVDGSRLTNLTNNFYYDILTNSPKSIVADKPITVAQYITSTNSSDGPTCGNSFNFSGDPEMIYISPVEQTIDKITLNSTSHFKITSHYINVVIKSSAVSSFTLDGANVNSSFISHTQDPSYSYAVFTVAAGAHRLKADVGFNAIAYGYGGTESYGYNAGTNIKDLYQFLSLRNEYTKINLPLTCQSTKFFFSITLPYKASSLAWDFGANTNITPNNNIAQNSPQPDSSYILDGRSLYVYSLPLLYSFNSTGTYPVKITANNQTSDGCNGIQELTYNVQVIDRPVAAFAATDTGCLTDSVFLTDASTGNGRQLVKWKWDFGDGTIDTMMSPHKAFAKSGTYSIKHTSINDIGCFADTTKLFTITPQPIANFNFLKAGCEGNPVTFTDASTIESGRIVKWNWNFGNGKAITNLTNVAVTNSFNAGTYTVSLQVESEAGCKSVVSEQAVLIETLPVSNFIAPQVCVNDPFAAFVDSSRVAEGGAGVGLTYNWNFGDANATPENPNISTVQNPQHKYSAAGPYNVALTVTSNAGCTATKTKAVFINGGLPIANFEIIDDGPVCSNAQVRIKNGSSIDIGTITKTQIIWDFQNNPTTIETDDTSVTGKMYYHTFPASPTVKTYQVKMLVFSGANCFNERIIQVTVNPAPKVVFADVPEFCVNSGVRLITQAKETSGLTGSFLFSGGGIAPEGLFNPVTTGAGSTAVTYTFTSDAGCRDSASQIIKVTSNPTVRLSSPLYVLEGGSTVLNPSVTGNAVKYFWTPSTYLDNRNIKSPISLPKDSITYKLSVTTQGGCEGNGEVTILILKDLGIPNSFTPNNDGVNDFWNIPSLSTYVDCTVEVFNRYGAIVYRSVGYTKPWNGTLNGSTLPVGVYYYIINPKNGKKAYTGNVTILR